VIAATTPFFDQLLPSSMDSAALEVLLTTGVAFEAHWAFEASARKGSNEHSSSNEEYNSVVVPTTHTTKLAQPKADPHLQAAGERVKAAAEELERLGIVDSAGKRVRTDLPTDMREGVDRDFGG
jgi:hypothetical protein